MNDRIWRVFVPHKHKNIDVVYPGRDQTLYTKLEAINLMHKFEQKCPDRVKPGHKLEIWTESDNKRFTLNDYREDFMGVRTEKD